MAQQPNINDLRVTGKAGQHLCAFAFQGAHKGQRFVKPQGGIWLPAGNASAREMNAISVFEHLSKAFGGAL